MKTIELKVDDSRLEAFLTIIRNLKNGMVQDIMIKDTDSSSFVAPWIEEVGDEENEYYIDMFRGMPDEDKIISSKERVTL